MGHIDNNTTLKETKNGAQKLHKFQLAKQIYAVGCTVAWFCISEYMVHVCKHWTTIRVSITEHKLVLAGNGPRVIVPM